MAFNMRHSMVSKKRPTIAGAQSGGAKRSSSSKVGRVVKPQEQLTKEGRSLVTGSARMRDGQKRPVETVVNTPGVKERQHSEIRTRVEQEQKEAPTYSEQQFEYKVETNSYITEHPENVLLQWQGPEYEVYPKSKKWYVIMGSIIALIAFYSVMTNSHIVAILFLIMGAVGFLYLNTPPRVLDYAITTDGFVVGDDLYHYDEIDSYWIFYEPPHTRVVSLHVHGKLFPYVHVSLHQVDPVDLRETLVKFVPEKRQDPTIMDAVERLLHI